MDDLKFITDLSIVRAKHQVTKRKAIAIQFWEHDLGKDDPWFVLPPNLAMKLAWFLLREGPKCLISNLWRDFFCLRRK